LKLFFVSDIHGSETCFRKLVNAGRFYGVDVLIMGGDLAGKELVPVVDGAARFRGTDFRLENDGQLQDFERRVAAVGGYTLRTDEAFVARLRSEPDLAEQTLRDLIVERTKQWVALANERLEHTGIRLLIGLGNDDFDELIPHLNAGAVAYAKDGTTDLGHFDLVSLGWSNVTPWHTNRECSEEELADKLAAAINGADPARTIFNIHVPPYDCGLDLVPRLDETLQIQLVGGQPDMVPVGSTAVAAAIADHQPVLSLHGHVHQARGSTRIGRTVVVNPGSEYDDASLLGALIEVKPNKVKRCQLVAG
jgi:Icc-related predicted phosphoesterase